MQEQQHTYPDAMVPREVVYIPVVSLPRLRASYLVGTAEVSINPNQLFAGELVASTALDQSLFTNAFVTRLDHVNGDVDLHTLAAIATETWLATIQNIKPRKQAIRRTKEVFAQRIGDIAFQRQAVSMLEVAAPPPRAQTLQTPRDDAYEAQRQRDMSLIDTARRAAQIRAFLKTLIQGGSPQHSTVNASELPNIFDILRQHPEQLLEMVTKYNAVLETLAQQAGVQPDASNDEKLQAAMNVLKDTTTLISAQTKEEMEQLESQQSLALAKRNADIVKIRTDIETSIYRSRAKWAKRREEWIRSTEAISESVAHFGADVIRASGQWIGRVVGVAISLPGYITAEVAAILSSHPLAVPPGVGFFGGSGTGIILSLIVNGPDIGMALGNGVILSAGGTCIGGAISVVIGIGQAINSRGEDQP